MRTDRHAFVSLHDGRPGDAIDMLNAAAVVARRGDPQLATRHWVAAAQAEAYAKVGDLNNCQRSLSAAEEVYSLHGQLQPGGWLRFDGSRLPEQRGTCYVELGLADPAAELLAQALSRHLSPRRHGSVLTDLATLGLHRRSTDDVIAHGSAAVELAHRTRSGYVVSRLQGLRPRLTPMLANPRIADLHEQIAGLSRIVR
jgi:hypothetical protein